MRKIRAGWLVWVVVALGVDAQGALTKVKGRVVAPDGSPVVGAEVATLWMFDDGKIAPWGGEKTDSDGRFQISVDFYKRPGGLMALSADRTSGGWITVDPEKIPESAAITAGPLVRVHGDFSCNDLDTKKPSWTNVYMMSEDGKIRLAQCSSRGGDLRHQASRREVPVQRLRLAAVAEGRTRPST